MAITPLGSILGMNRLKHPRIYEITSSYFWEISVAKKKRNIFQKAGGDRIKHDINLGIVISSVDVMECGSVRLVELEGQ